MASRPSVGHVEHVGRHRPAQQPNWAIAAFGPGAVREDAAEDARAGAARAIFSTSSALQSTARSERPAQRRARHRVLSDRIAVGDAGGRGAGCEHHLDLRHRGGVKAGAERGEERRALPAPGLPSPRRRRGCRATPSRGSCSSPVRSRGPRPGTVRRLLLFQEFTNARCHRRNPPVGAVAAR